MLSGLDSDHNRNTRITVNAINITRDGFEIDFQTWSDSIIYGVGYTWIAYDQD